MLDRVDWGMGLIILFAIFRTTPKSTGSNFGGKVTENIAFLKFANDTPQVDSGVEYVCFSSRVAKDSPLIKFFHYVHCLRRSNL